MGVPGVYDIDQARSEAAMSAQRNDGLIQMIAQNDDKHEAGHKRLRDDLNALQEDTAEGLHRLTTKYNSLEQRLSKLENTPTNIEKMMLTPKIMVSIVIFAVTIAGSIWSVKSDIRDITTQMTAKKTSDDNTAKLQELQYTTLQKTIDEMKAAQKLQQLELQSFREQMLTMPKGDRR